MAVIYLRSSDGSDASDGLTWANAKATLAAALTAAGVGGTVYMSDAHNESAAGEKTFTSPGTAASPVIILCVDDAGDPEPPTALATTGVVATTDSDLEFAGFAYAYGVTFTAGSGFVFAGMHFQSSSPWWWRLDSCKLRLPSTFGGNQLKIGGSNGDDDKLLELHNTTIEFGEAGQGIAAGADFVWTGTASAIVSGTLPTTLFQAPPVSYVSSTTLLQGVDLSALGSGKNLILISGGSAYRFVFQDCKLGSSVAVTTGNVAGQGGGQVELINCDSGDTNYRYFKKVYQGEISQETTIVRTGGSTDGTTPISHKFVTTANSKFYSPLVGPWVTFWAETPGAFTIEAETVTDNVTLTDAEAWIEVEYPGTSGFPLGLFANDRAADILATPANQTSSSVAWTTTGLTTPVKQTLSKAITTAEKGVLRARVCVAKASTTVYVDLLRLASSGRQFMVAPGTYMNEAGSGFGGERRWILGPH